MLCFEQQVGGDNLTIGENIKKARQEAGYTQKELARKSGLAEISIRQYENGKREPRLEKLEAIADSLNISISKLLLLHLEPTPKSVELMENVLECAKETDQKELDRRKLSCFPENMRERINENFDKMNVTGQKRLVEYSEDILDKYRKDSE